MSWRRWKMGVFVALLGGFFDGGLVAFADPNINKKALFFLIGFWICKDAGLFLKEHPVEKLVDNTTILTKEEVTTKNEENSQKPSA